MCEPESEKLWPGNAPVVEARPSAKSDFPGSTLESRRRTQRRRLSPSAEIRLPEAVYLKFNPNVAFPRAPDPGCEIVLEKC